MHTDLNTQYTKMIDIFWYTLYCAMWFSLWMWYFGRRFCHHVLHLCLVIPFYASVCEWQLSSVKPTDEEFVEYKQWGIVNTRLPCCVKTVRLHKQIQMNERIHGHNGKMKKNRATQSNKESNFHRNQNEMKHSYLYLLFAMRSSHHVISWFLSCDCVGGFRFLCISYWEFPNKLNATMLAMATEIATVNNNRKKKKQILIPTKAQSLLSITYPNHEHIDNRHTPKQSHCSCIVIWLSDVVLFFSRVHWTSNRWFWYSLYSNALTKPYQEPRASEIRRSRRKKHSAVFELHRVSKRWCFR